MRKGQVSRGGGQKKKILRKKLQIEGVTSISTANLGLKNVGSLIFVYKGFSVIFFVLQKNNLKH